MSKTGLRVVIDTSSLVSYLLTRGELMRQVIEAWRQDEFELLSSPQTLKELRRVLSRPEIRDRSVVPLGPFADGLERYSSHVPGTLELQGVCRDPKDDKFIACALVGKAHYLVSSDRDLLAVQRYEGLCISNPGHFLVALHLARLPLDSILKRYSQETLQSILSELCLDSDTHEKLLRASA